MNAEIKHGRTVLWLLLGSACLIFLVNVFYPLYLTSTNISDRTGTFVVVAVFAGLAVRGKRYARIAIGASLLLATLVNILAMFAALSSGNFTAILIIFGSSLMLAAVGWPLITSKSIRAFEIAREPVST